MEFRKVEVRAKQYAFAVEDFYFVAYRTIGEMTMVRCNHHQTTKCRVKGLIRCGKFSYKEAADCSCHNHAQPKLVCGLVREKVREKIHNRANRRVPVGQLVKAARTEVS